MLQRESDDESGDCGIRLVPLDRVRGKSRGVEYELRKKINFLSSLRKEYEVNMLELEKELLDEKIGKSKIEEEIKEFLETSIKARHQWQQEKGSLEKKLAEAREKIAEQKNKLKLREDNVKVLEDNVKVLEEKLKLQELNSRARSPSVDEEVGGGKWGA